VLADLADYAFIAAEAGRLEELRVAAMEARIDADLAVGRHAALTGEPDQLVAEHPLRERLHAHPWPAAVRIAERQVPRAAQGLRNDRAWPAAARIAERHVPRAAQRLRDDDSSGRNRLLGALPGGGSARFSSGRGC
jgi:hypothetical protein